MPNRPQTRSLNFTASFYPKTAYTFWNDALSFAASFYPKTAYTFWNDALAPDDVMSKKDLKKLKKLPYRRCAGVVLLNSKGRVWVGRRSQKWLQKETPKVWQMPQGGIDRGETPEQAAIRELYEETGAKSVEVLAESRDWLSYDLPDEALGVALRGKYRGQRQKWFVMRFTGKDSEINVDGPDGHKAEFDGWKWVKMKRLPGLVAPFKRQVYEQLVKEFKHLRKKS